jgi:hypothetical protein
VARNRAADRRKHQTNLDYVRAIAAAGGCTDCRRHDGRLEYHHRDPATKVFDVGHPTTRSLATIDAEIAKCDVLCPKCHHARHIAADPDLRVRSGRAGGAAGKGTPRPWQTPEWYAKRKAGLL